MIVPIHEGEPDKSQGRKATGPRFLLEAMDDSPKDPKIAELLLQYNKKEKNMNEAEETKKQPITDEQIDPTVESLRKEKDWFIGVEEGDSRHYYGKEELTTELRTNILEGKHEKDNGVVIHLKDEDGNWQQTESALDEFAKSHFKLQVLYQPVWSHAIAGLKWGAIGGVALKLLDTLIMLGSVDPTLAFFFLVAVALCFIPRIGIMAVIVFAFITMKFTQMNMFLMGLSAGLIGATLGCLPGMAVGGIVGLSRKNSFSLAKDASPEPDGLVLKAVILPLISGVGLIAFYVLVFNPWLMGVLE